jgi:hypothetical protein
LPTVSESGNVLPAPILSKFPTDLEFNPLKFTPEELTEFNDQHEIMKQVQVRSSMAVNNARERYHVHQQLLRKWNFCALRDKKYLKIAVIRAIGALLAR